MSYRSPMKQGPPSSAYSGIGGTSLSLIPKAHDATDSRKRQSKRDEAIRRKIENDLSKKRKEQGRYSKRSTRHKGAPGTVSSLRPNEPILCKTSTSALEAARLMGAKRENCILVVDDQKRLVGIFTAKDLAFRVVASGKVAAFVTVDQIMTKDPFCVTDDTPASETLNLMVQKGFRHLPILDSEGSIVGVLDITKCYQEAMEKLERMYDSSKKLYDALDSVNSEIGITQQPTQVVKYFENLKDLMGGPILESVLDDTTLPVYTNVKSSVFEAATLMKENRTTAVLVKDSNNEEVTGIFTSKDVVLRVIAAGLDPKTCSVVRVMTPQPDCAPKDLTIHEALRKMFDGHYLNLPVIEDNEIVGIVEVLKLTYATLNQLKAVKSNDENATSSNGENPVWNRFWTTLDETESVHSDSFSHLESSTHHTTPYSLSNHQHNEMVLAKEVHPNDSISCANERPDYEDEDEVKSSVDDYINKSAISEYQAKEIPFGFKFRSPSGRVHRITLKPKEGIISLRSLITEKLHPKELKLLCGSNVNLIENTDGSAYFETDFDDDDDSEVGIGSAVSNNSRMVNNNFAISYRDDEGDLVAITTDQDLTDCVVLSRNLHYTKADIFIHNPRENADSILSSKSGANPEQKFIEDGTKSILPTNAHIYNNSEHHQKNPSIFNSPPKKDQDELLPGVPNELLLPGAIFTLAATILIVFAFGSKRR